MENAKDIDKVAKQDVFYNDSANRSWNETLYRFFIITNRNSICNRSTSKNGEELKILVLSNDGKLEKKTAVAKNDYITIGTEEIAYCQLVPVFGEDSLFHQKRLTKFYEYFPNLASSEAPILKAVDPIISVADLFALQKISNYSKFCQTRISRRKYFNENSFTKEKKEEIQRVKSSYMEKQ